MMSSLLWTTIGVICCNNEEQWYAYNGLWKSIYNNIFSNWTIAGCFSAICIYTECGVPLYIEKSTKYALVEHGNNKIHTAVNLTFTSSSYINSGETLELSSIVGSLWVSLQKLSLTLNIANLPQSVREIYDFPIGRQISVCMIGETCTKCAHSHSF